MKKLTKTILKRTIWLGRGAATVMGLAMLLALIMGLASTALAGTGIGARFDLGKTNVVNAASSLVGNVNGPVLTVKNQNGTGSDNVPLSLETTDIGFIPPPPMKVDSFTKVERLNADLLDGVSQEQFLRSGGKAADADRLDGKDSTEFLPRKTYTKTGPGVLAQSTPRDLQGSASCDPGDPALSGGYQISLGGPDSQVYGERTEGSTYQFTVHLEAGLATPSVTCADLPPLR